jgi:peptidyl-prolyl cis-trans isomerase D
MAALQSIRSRGKLIAICVGGALLAFVLGDFINSGATIFGASQTKIGDINGTSIDYNEFMGRVEQRETFMKLATGRSTLDAQTSDEVRDYCWEQAVRENTIGKFLEKQGIQATDDELVYMIETGNVTPFMRQAFANPETGMFEAARVKAYAAQNDPESRFIWRNLENELKDSREYVKYISMVSAGLYVTNAEVENEFKNRTHISDFKYVALPLSEVKDEEISVTDAALKDYYSKNQNAFFRLQESRDVAYVSFDVIPTKEDSAVIRESVEKLGIDQKDDETYQKGGANPNELFAVDL